MDLSCGCYHQGKYFFGTFIGMVAIATQSRRIEKSFQAHNGCVIQCLSFNDCIITCGEDGYIKMWSTQGSLRATLARSNLPVHALCIQDSQIVYAALDMLMICDIYGSAKRSIKAGMLVSAIAVHGSQILIGGTNGTLSLHHNGNKHQALLKSKIYALHINDKLGLIYTGLSDGICILSTSLKLLTVIPTKSIVHSIYALGNGQILYSAYDQPNTAFYYPEHLLDGYKVYYKNGFVIEQLSNGSVFTVDQPLDSIKQILLSHGVVVVLKNRLRIISEQESVIDVSFEIISAKISHRYLRLTKNYRSARRVQKDPSVQLQGQVHGHLAKCE